MCSCDFFLFDCCRSAAWCSVSNMPITISKQISKLFITHDLEEITGLHCLAFSYLTFTNLIYKGIEGISGGH